MIFDIIFRKTYKNSIKAKLILIGSVMGVICISSFISCGFGFDFKLSSNMHDIIAYCGIFSLIIMILCPFIYGLCKKEENENDIL